MQGKKQQNHLHYGGGSELKAIKQREDKRRKEEFDATVVGRGG